MFSLLFEKAVKKEGEMGQVISFGLPLSQHIVYSYEASEVDIHEIVCNDPSGDGILFELKLKRLDVLIIEIMYTFFLFFFIVY